MGVATAMTGAADGKQGVLPVKFGVMLPNRGPLLGLFSVDDLLTITEQADAIPSIDSVWFGDSILAKPRFECNTILAAAAARTRRVKLGPACFASFPLRNPIVTALEWASIDLLSKGRSIWAICVGGNPKSGGDFESEYRAFGLDPKQRISRVEEAIEVVKRLWTQEHASFDGKHFRFDGVNLQPKPYQKPRPPIWLVATPKRSADPAVVDRALRRVVRQADGWMVTRVSVDDFRFGLQRLREIAVEEGRDPYGFEACLCYNVLIDDDRDRAFRTAREFLNNYYMTEFEPEVIDLWVAYGSAAQCAEKVGAYLRAGVTTMVVRFPCRDQLGQMELFAERVASQFLGS